MWLVQWEILDLGEEQDVWVPSNAEEKIWPEGLKIPLSLPLSIPVEHRRTLY